jgi:cystathionine gamma-lyase
LRFDTLVVQAAQRPTNGSGDVVPPIHLAATFERTVQDPPRYFYGRGENPTREALEACLAALEGAAFATTFSSGQAAAATALSLVEPGRRVVVSDDVYSGTAGLFDAARRAGVDVQAADLSDPAQAGAALAAPVDLVWIETPSNPRLKITDLAAVCALAHEHGATVLVDNTFATPALQQPLRWADVTLYSTTKAISGHLDVLGGALVYDDPQLHDRLRSHRSLVGSVPGALDCYLVRRGLKTLALRVARQTETAALVVDALRREPAVLAVHYPDGPVAARQMTGFGAVLSFEYAGDAAALLERVRLFAPAVSLGGVQSLIECPALMSHAAIAGMDERLVRVSVGIEDAGDLVEDLCTAVRAG